MDLNFTPAEEAFRAEVQGFLKDKLPARLSGKVKGGLHLTRADMVEWHAILNARGYVSGTGHPFQRRIVQHIRHRHRLRSRFARLRARGLLTRDEIADRLKVSADTVKMWARHGLLTCYPCNDKHERLYEPPGPNAPIKMQGRPLADRLRTLLPDQTNGVQYET